MDRFLDAFIESNDEVKSRMLDASMFGQELDNEEADVPLYDQYNRGLVATQEIRPRMNLSLDPMQKRCGVTGTIPSAEEGIAMGAMPQPRTLMIELEAEPSEEEMEMSRKRRGLSR
jgi:hypothetical protein